MPAMEATHNHHGRAESLRHARIWRAPVRG
jgi:hypothetical protein